MAVGPGDDCAVVARNDDWDTLLKTDVVVEGVHFTRETEPRRIGRKALARAVSDIAAMGGLPEHALITILTHKTRPVELLEAFMTALMKWLLSSASPWPGEKPPPYRMMGLSLT